MKSENVSLLQEKVTYALVRAPHFNPEEGQTRDSVLAELRRRLAAAKGEWWGGDELYSRMSAYINQAEDLLNEGNASEAKRAFGEVYAIIDQTPRPKER
mgnify:CR=1 FL=1